jgi:hypothetical protein
MRRLSLLFRELTIPVPKNRLTPSDRIVETGRRNGCFKKVEDLARGALIDVRSSLDVVGWESRSWDIATKATNLPRVATVVDRHSQTLRRFAGHSERVHLWPFIALARFAWDFGVEPNWETGIPRR